MTTPTPAAPVAEKAREIVAQHRKQLADPDNYRILSREEHEHLIDLLAALAQEPRPEVEPVACPTCGGRGEIGGWSGGVASIDGGGGYSSEPCPDCAPANWSGLPHDLYVTSVRKVDAIVWEATLCSVPMAIGPEVRFTLATPPAPAGVKVKALEWSEVERDRGDGQSDKHGEWEAPSIVGVYAINISTCGDMHAPWEAFGGDDSKLGNFVTLDKAKAAVQADYERRIRSALLPPDPEAQAAPAQAREERDDAAAWIITNRTTGNKELSFKPLADLPFNRERFECEPLCLAKPVSGPERSYDVFRRLLSAAKLLYANSEGCAVNHYAEDFATNGLPGWLHDCATDILAAEAELSLAGECRS